MHHSRFSTTAVLIFLLLLLLLSSSTSSTAHRRFLHQPLFPFDQPISQPPLTAPSPQQPKYPFSSLTPPDTTTQNPFFPFYPSSPPPPSPPSTNSAFATFPANISSLVLPSTSHPSHNPVKLISLVVSLFSLLLFISLLLLLLLRRRRHPGHRDLKTDSLRLFPPDTPTSDNTAPLDNSKKPPPPLHPIRTPTTTSSEFLYLGTLVSSREPPPSVQNDAKAPKITYHRLGSPELHPLPPLPRQHSGQIYQNAPPAAPPENHENEEEFLWSRESTAKNASASRTGLPPTALNDGVRANVLNKSRSLNSLNCNSPAYSVSPDNSPSVVPNTASPRSMQSKSPDSLVSFPGPLRRFIPPPPAREPRKVPLFSPFSPSSTEDGSTTRDCSPRPSDFSSIGKVPPTPPHPLNGPPELVAPSWKVLVQNVSAEKLSSGNAENESMENLKQKLTPLHLDKVRANSDRAMVWDQLNSTSLQLNEEMIETLFMVNANGNAREGVTPELNQENLVLDLKKSRNIDMLLRALNVTVDEVCEALVEGNADALGAELLECLLKMASTKEEERRFRECKDESPFKLGTAEVFLKALLDVPFAFKRVDALVYVSNFESETERLKMSFHTLEWACNELKSSRLFRKLLEAVLKTGNRMSVGTNRGDAHAFKLDTLLKLVDVKDGDGKTTLLHFVVQEIIRTEGARLDQNPNAKQNHPPTLGDEVHYRKLGLQVISGLSGELTNVKKAAAMDADVLSKDVAELAKGISKINEVLKLNGKLPSNEAKFSDCMNEFLKKAEMEIMNIQAQEGIAISMVKGLTEYFHGDLAKEEAHPFRLFVVVREFLLILDRVCKDVGKINERTVMNSGREISMAVAPSLPRFDEKARGSSSDDESSSSS